jgi:hypothetical protein
MREPNPWIGINYIPDNPKMAEPPAFVLQRFFDFDADLVILPSRHVPFAYVIARRRRLTAGLTDKALEDTIIQPDTKMCMANGLVPVTLMYRTGSNWNIDPVIASLKSRDIWEHGGGDKFADKLDAADEAREKATRAQIKDDMWMRSGDAWRSYQARTGQRTKYRYGHETRTERRETRTAPSTSGSTAGSGIVVAYR